MAKLSNLIPLLILFLFVGVFAWIGYQMYVFSQDLATRGAKKLEKKNVVLTKDGMKVHVKEVGAEEYVDRTQGAFVKAWSYTSTPGYQSKLWSGKPQEGNNGGKNK